MVIFCWAQVRVQAHCPSNIHPQCWAQGGHGNQHVKRWTHTWGGPVKLCHVGLVSPRPWPRVIVFMVFMVIYSMYGITNATALILDARAMKTTDPTRSSTLFHTACQPSTDVSPWNLKDPGLWTCPHGQLSHGSVTVVTQLQAVTHVVTWPHLVYQETPHLFPTDHPTLATISLQHQQTRQWEGGCHIKDPITWQTTWQKTRVSRERWQLWWEGGDIFNGGQLKWRDIELVTWHRSTTVMPT